MQSVLLNDVREAIRRVVQIRKSRGADSREVCGYLAELLVRWNDPEIRRLVVGMLLEELGRADVTGAREGGDGV
mgnify:CR=1 FL=1